jgi:hypothetical protein
MLSVAGGKTENGRSLFLLNQRRKWSNSIGAPVCVAS